MVTRGAQCGQNIGPILEKLTTPEIETERDAFGIFAIAVAKIDEFGDQRRGQVINAEKAQIF